MLITRWGPSVANLIVHPFLISTFPVLAFYATNLGQTEVRLMLRPIFASLLLAGTVLAVIKLVVRDARRSALVASLLLIAFGSYGHTYDALKSAGLSGEGLVRHRYLLPIALAPTAFAVWSAMRARAGGNWTGAFNLIAVTLWLQPAIRITAFEVERSLQQVLRGDSQIACTLRPPETARTPDVYLIVMDAYERDDVLLEMHNYDNGWFIEALEERGFYVARGSLSNYRHTEMSIASVLNFDYLQTEENGTELTSPDHPGFGPAIGQPRLRTELECLGYQGVSMESGVYWSEWRDAPYFFERDGSPLRSLQLAGGLSREETFLLNGTVLRAAIDLRSRLTGAEVAFDEPLADHRDRILFAFEQLRAIPNLPGKKLVFAHIISPHPPMVFGRDGEFVTMASFETDPSRNDQDRPLLQAYADQVHYLNQELLLVVDAILEKSDVPPVIVIQGDHGWADRNAEDKLSILNAILLPRNGSSVLHPRHTPVNTFRHMLNLYFGGRFQILDDISYYSTDDAPYDFLVVNNTWKPDD